MSTANLSCIILSVCVVILSCWYSCLRQDINSLNAALYEHLEVTDEGTFKRYFASVSTSLGDKSQLPEGAETWPTARSDISISPHEGESKESGSTTESGAEGTPNAKSPSRKDQSELHQWTRV
jgi:hypothetical protein